MSKKRQNTCAGKKHLLCSDLQTDFMENGCLEFFGHYSLTKGATSKS